MRVDEAFCKRHEEHWKPLVQSIADKNKVSYHDVVVAASLLATADHPNVRELMEWAESDRHITVSLTVLGLWP